MAHTAACLYRSASYWHSLNPNAKYIYSAPTNRETVPRDVCCSRQVFLIVLLLRSVGVLLVPATSSAVTSASQPATSQYGL